MSKGELFTVLKVSLFSLIISYLYVLSKFNFDIRMVNIITFIEWFPMIFIFFLFLLFLGKRIKGK